MTKLKRIVAAAASIAAGLLAGGVAVAEPAESLVDAIKGGALLLDVRPRYEMVDQDGFAKNANAFTVRTKLGWETATWNGLTGLLEFEDVHALGSENFNSTTNGRTQFPIVADPNTTELHRAQIAWRPSEAFAATVGRQIINIDDQRFIGSVSWRQDEQTFDAGRADVNLGRFSASYMYLDKINRVFAQAQDWDSDSHVVNAAYALGAPLRLEGFMYALDFRQSPANSTLTYGGRVTGKLKLSPVTLSYTGAYARQTEYRNNPGRFGLNYWEVSAAGTADIVTLKGEYEVLGGDGLRGFATPLATLHAFQGWADVFLTTPANGIKDANVTLAVAPKIRFEHFSHLVLTGVYHKFDSDVRGQDLGSEVDLQATAAITRQLSALVAFADYDGVRNFASRRKLWIGFEFKL